jgi:hypothetical protein
VFWQQGQSNHATSSQPPRWHAEFRASREPAGQLLKGHSRTLASQAFTAKAPSGLEPLFSENAGAVRQAPNRLRVMSPN